MTTRALILSQIAWVGVAAAAFYFGRDSVDRPAGAAQATGAPPGIVLDSTGMVARANPSALGSGGGGAGGQGAASALVRAPSVTAAQMEKALPQALRETDPIKRDQQISALIAALTPENLPAALDAFEAGPRGDGHDEAWRNFLHAWGRMDGAAATAYALSSESPRRDHFGGSYAISGWAMSDAAGAKGFVENMDAGHGKEWMHYGVVKGLMNVDPAAAAAFSEANKLGRARGRSMDVLAQRFIETGGAEGVTGWLDGIDHTGENDMLPYKRYAANTAMEQLSQSDPAAARSWIETNAAQPYLTGNAIAAAARRGSGGDYGEAAAWATNLPASDARRDAVSDLVGRWAGSDANAAGEWLGANQNLPEYDAAAASFAGQVARQDPESAVAWASTVQDPQQQRGAYERVYRGWREADRAAADAWWGRVNAKPEAPPAQ